MKLKSLCDKLSAQLSVKGASVNPKTVVKRLPTLKDSVKHVNKLASQAGLDGTGVQPSVNFKSKDNGRSVFSCNQRGNHNFKGCNSQMSKDTETFSGNRQSHLDNNIGSGKDIVVKSTICNSDVKYDNICLTLNVVKKENLLNKQDCNQGKEDSNCSVNFMDNNTNCSSQVSHGAALAEHIVKSDLPVMEKLIKSSLVNNVCSHLSNQSHRPPPRAFRHDIKGAYKQIGVHFKKKTYHTFVQSKAILREGSSNADYLRVVSQVVHSGKPNYLGARIQLPSMFNLHRWEERLKNYHDKNLVNLLKFGFPLGIQKREQLSRRDIDNHSSAQQFHSEISDFITKELNLGAMLGPFSVPPPILAFTALLC